MLPMKLIFVSIHLDPACMILKDFEQLPQRVFESPGDLDLPEGPQCLFPVFALPAVYSAAASGLPAAVCLVDLQELLPSE